jgi:hypothetical protein
MFLLVGCRLVAPREPSPPVRITCPSCGEDAWFIGRLRRAWYTLLMIPVCPLEPPERGQHISQCTACGSVFERCLEQMPHLARAVSGNNWQHTIRLYNKLRQNPTDSATLYELIEAYEAIGEPAEALRTARHFPGALAASPHCRAALVRVQKLSCAAGRSPHSPLATG